MRDLPIIFSTPMVKSLLAGLKTQTRRMARQERHHRIQSGKPATTVSLHHSPWQRAQPGDRLWVRETWAQVGDNDDDIHACPDLRVHAYYRADSFDTNLRWRSPIHMPRVANRITLPVREVRLQRLQDITEDDAQAEGAPRGFINDEGKFYLSECGTCLAGFIGLWDHLHGSGAWDANPDVIALTFDVHQVNIDRLAITPEGVNA